MKTIDVEGLPEPVVAALEVMVAALRQQANGSSHEVKPDGKVELPSWPGSAIGNLSRAEIYEDVG